jgi:hypothetical protein
MLAMFVLSNKCWIAESSQFDPQDNATLFRCAQTERSGNSGPFPSPLPG